ncbi:hypothetical protein E4U21_005868 [Claviceps maximensis]|nr:hypothetical protein E4U21_005868 [Claviceps maximensis]
MSSHQRQQKQRQKQKRRLYKAKPSTPSELGAVVRKRASVLTAPLKVPSCLVFGAAAVLAVRLPGTLTMFSVCTFACVGVVSCGESLCILFNRLMGYTGEQVLELYHFDVDPVVNVACLADCVVAHRLLAWLVLRVMRARWTDR